MQLRKTYSFIDVLQYMVYSYNNIEHKTMGMAPSDVTPGDIERRLWWHVYKLKKVYYKWRACKVDKLKYKGGDKGRITHSAKTFQGAYDETLTPEIFVVSQGFQRQGIKKYRLEDLDGEEIKGIFYEPKLQVVTYNPDKAFAVERKIRSVGVGRNRQILVKWVGWPEKFNSQITEANYQKIQRRGR